MQSQGGGGKREGIEEGGKTCLFLIKEKTREKWGPGKSVIVVDWKRMDRGTYKVKKKKRGKESWSMERKGGGLFVIKKRGRRGGFAAESFESHGNAKKRTGGSNRKGEKK